MGWTWGEKSRILELYPSLANIPELLERWPSLKAAVQEKAAAEAAKQAQGAPIQVAPARETPPPKID